MCYYIHDHPLPPKVLMIFGFWFFGFLALPVVLQEGLFL